ncbi:hypothetical protein DL96DRAFT_1595597 [Flagelloscypha sp. PMI_526]|nr:hypothetical protein DL96DRAFT_1595597 [Flagelloscypha sp. PMI_526]
MGVPHLPLEIWMQIYDLLTHSVTTRRELASFVLINRFAYSCIYHRLFETLVLGNDDWTPLDALFKLLESGQKPTVKRLHLIHPPPSSDNAVIEHHIAALKNCSESITRLKCLACPQFNLVIAIAGLSNLSWLEVPVQLFFALQNLASSSAQPYRHSLARLSLFFYGGLWGAEQGPDATYSYEETMDRLDFTLYPHLKQVALEGGIHDIKAVTHIILERSPSVQLIVVLCRPMTTKADVLGQYGTPWPGLDDNRVVFYVSDSITTGNRSILAFESWSLLRERPLGAAVGSKRSGWTPTGDIPLDDWGEITACHDVSLWTWAIKVQKAGEKTFYRPVLKKHSTV